MLFILLLFLITNSFCVDSICQTLLPALKTHIPCSVALLSSPKIFLTPKTSPTVLEAVGRGLSALQTMFVTTLSQATLRAWKPTKEPL